MNLWGWMAVQDDEAYEAALRAAHGCWDEDREDFARGAQEEDGDA